MPLLCPLPERQHMLFGQLNQEVLLHFNYLVGKTNSPVKHMRSTDLLLLDCHKAAPYYNIHIYIYKNMNNVKTFFQLITQD